MNTSIVVCGLKIDIGSRVVLWDEPGGLNGYSEAKSSIQIEDRKTGKVTTKTVAGKRYSKRSLIKPDMVSLQKIVNQFFIHHSGLYHSQTTFNVLHNERKLSVHFILDDNGTLYQTLDLVECAWHGGKNNGCSVGIEVDSRALADKNPDAYDEAHQKKQSVLPHKKKLDKVQNNWINGYEFTDPQYATLIRLAIVLGRTFPRMKVANKFDFPRDAKGRIMKEFFENSVKHCGLICHYHASLNKIDPISFDHSRFLKGVTSNNPSQPSTSIFDTWGNRQRVLTDLGYNPGAIDGIFGPKTDAAMKLFQKNNGITEDDWGVKTEHMAQWNVQKL